GDDLERAGDLDERVARRLRLERVGGRQNLEPRLLREAGAHALGELGMRVQPGADRRAAERDLPEVRQRRADAVVALADLGGIAAELLAERYRHRVHQMRTPRLDDVVELRRLA